jgi:hypothetical protein
MEEEPAQQTKNEKSEQMPIAKEKNIRPEVRGG